MSAYNSILALKKKKKKKKKEKRKKKKTGTIALPLFVSFSKLGFT